MSFIAGYLLGLEEGCRLTEKDITENGVYRAADDDADGYCEVRVNVASSADIIPLAAEAGNVYTASEYGVDGFSPVTAVGKRYTDITEASEAFVETELCSGDYYFDFVVENNTDSAAIMGYKTMVTAGIKNRSDGEWVRGKTAGMLYGQGAKNVRLVRWESNGRYYSYRYTYTDYNGKLREVSTITPVRVTDCVEFTVEGVERNG